MKRGASLRGRLAATMVLLLTLVLVLAIVSGTAVGRLDRESTGAIGDLVDGARMTNSLTVGITEQVRLTEQALRLPEPATLRLLRRVTDSTHQILHQMRQLPGQGPEDQAQLNRIGSAQARMEVAHAITMTWQALDRAELAAASVVVASTETASVLAEVRTLAGVQAARALATTGTVRARADTLRRVLWGIFFVALTIGVTSAWLTVRSVDGPLARLVAATQRFSTGDLRATDLSGMPAELAALGSAMNTMGSRIRQLLAAVGQEGQEIGASAGDFSAMSQELAATSGQVSEAMVHLTEAADSQVGALRDADRHLATLRETGATTLRAAQRVTAVAASIAAMAQDHRTHVQTASATLMTLRETVRTSAGEVREAIRLADRLGGIVERDRQLATKVGVLAVNTSIEAARAGVHGLGIVAVAEELRLLGELCDQVADEGERGVEAIRAQVRATAATLDAGTTAVLGVEATTDRAATALAEIIRNVAEANRAAAQVVQDAAASREGITAMLERTALVAQAAADHAATGESVSAAAEEQAAATQEMATAAARLNDAAQRLTSLLGDFRT